MFIKHELKLYNTDNIKKVFIKERKKLNSEKFWSLVLEDYKGNEYFLEDFFSEESAILWLEYVYNILNFECKLNSSWCEISQENVDKLKKLRVGDEP